MSEVSDDVVSVKHVDSGSDKEIDVPNVGLETPQPEE